MARVNDVPRRTRSSRLGVWIRGLPRAEIVSGRWSSLTMNRTFGRSADRHTAQRQQTRKNKYLYIWNDICTARPAVRSLTIWQFPTAQSGQWLERSLNLSVFGPTRFP